MFVYFNIRFFSKTRLRLIFFPGEEILQNLFCKLAVKIKSLLMFFFINKKILSLTSQVAISDELPSGFSF